MALQNEKDIGWEGGKVSTYQYVIMNIKVIHIPYSKALTVKAIAKEKDQKPNRIFRRRDFGDIIVSDG